MTERKTLFRAEDLATLSEWRFTHQHNPDATRFTRSPGDIAGCVDMGVHLVRVPAGGQSSEFHSHEEDEEFIYILSGRAIAEIGEEAHEVGPGDLMVFPKNSPAHMMRNPFDADVVFLVAGTRAPIDICNYPRKNLRQYRVHGRREYVDAAQIKYPKIAPEKVT